MVSCSVYYFRVVVHCSLAVGPCHNLDARACTDEKTRQTQRGAISYAENIRARTKTTAEMREELTLSRGMTMNAPPPWASRTTATNLVLTEHMLESHALREILMPSYPCETSHNANKFISCQESKATHGAQQLPAVAQAQGVHGPLSLRSLGLHCASKRHCATVI